MKQPTRKESDPLPIRHVISVDEAACALGVSSSTIRHHIRAGNLVSIKREGVRTLIPVSEVNRVMQTGFAVPGKLAILSPEQAAHLTGFDISIIRAQMEAGIIFYSVPGANGPQARTARKPVALQDHTAARRNRK